MHNLPYTAVIKFVILLRKSELGLLRSKELPILYDIQQSYIIPTKSVIIMQIFHITQKSCDIPELNELLLDKRQTRQTCAQDLYTIFP